MKITTGLLLAAALPIIVCKAMDNESLKQRIILFQAFEDYNFHQVRTILDNNPTIIDEDPKNVFWISRINASFAHKFMVIAPLSYDYRTYFKDFVHDGFNLNTYDQSGVPLLCNVIKYNQGDKYLDLLKGGAQVNIQDIYGKSPIVYAAEALNYTAIEKLLSYGAIVNQDTYSSVSLYHYARSLLFKLFSDQLCYICHSHDCDLFDIPCVNRHLGSFICMRCCDVIDYYNYRKCPICVRSLDKF